MHLFRHTIFLLSTHNTLMSKLTYKAIKMRMQTIHKGERKEHTGKEKSSITIMVSQDLV